MHAVRSRRLAAGAAVALALLLPAGPAPAEGTAERAETLLLQDPTVSDRAIVFVHAGDLWAVGREGGEARRLTSSPGLETSPRLGPDGSLVAFTGQYQGNPDVYVMPAAGGEPRRLTWHPGEDRVLGWHPDGKRVLFASRREGGAEVDRPYLVSPDGGMPEALPIPRGSHASYAPDGTRLAFTPFRDAFRSWKRYRGGRTGPVWIADLATLEVEEVPHGRATDTFPCWAGGFVYFASDRDGHMNLHRFRPGGSAVEPVTRFADFDVRSVSAGGGAVVFEQAGAIHLHDPASGRTTRLRIHVPTDAPAVQPRWVEAKGDPVGPREIPLVRAGDPSPNGKRVALEVRGEIVTVPRENGDPRDLTASPGAHDRSPAWSPDGERVAWLSDASGENRLLVRDEKGRGEPRSYDLGGARSYNDPTWSPDGKRIAFSDKSNRIAILELETGAVTTVRGPVGSLGELHPSFSFSRDSRWLAFEDHDPATLFERVALHEVATGRVQRLTDAFGSAYSPAFSRDGKHLYFAASTDIGPNSFGLDMSTSAARDFSASLYCAVLQKDGKDPLAPKSDEAGDKGDDRKDERKDEKAGTGKDGEKDKDKEKEKEKEPPPPAIDPDGLDQRILALPAGSGRFHALRCTKDRILWLDGDWEEPGVLRAFDFEKRTAAEVRRDVRSLRVSAGGEHVLLQTPGGWLLVDGQGANEKRLPLDGVRVRVEPAKEWRQILREVWRVQRDYFYDPGMHGVDWPAMWDRWSAFLPHVHHRADLNVLLMEMVGELSCGHEYVWGGDMGEGAPKGVPTGLLGADWTVDSGRYRIARIYRGQNWNPGLRAPLTGPGVDAREGDYLVSVDGRPATTDRSLFAWFEGTADRQVELLLSATPDGANPRKAAVVPVPADQRLRKLAWVEENRRRVDRLSGGKVAYVYMPDTGKDGMHSFDRDFYGQLDRRALVLDERYNHGGQVADYVVATLSRTPLCYWGDREQWFGRTPWGSFPGPKAMVINESAGSGGDAMPWMFRKLGLGPLVGTRTWGGLVGISGNPGLMDGGGFTVPTFGITDTGGTWVVENEGVPPDVEVIETPKDAAAGRDPQLEKAVELVLAELERRPAPKPPVRRAPTPR